MQYPAFLITALLVAGAVSAVEPANVPIAIAKADQEFITKARMCGLYEVKSAEMAMKHSLPAEVQRFAERLIDDHTTAGKELDELAKRKGFASQTIIDEKHQDKLTKQEEAKDKAYVETWLEYQVAAHKDGVAHLEEAVKDAKDADVRAFAAKHLPTMRAHLDTAKKLEAKHD